MKSLRTILCFIYLLPLLSVSAGDEYIISDNDPLIFSDKERLEKIIKKLETRESIELLLGAGSENENSDVVTYMVIPDTIGNQYSGFVTHVLLTYDQAGKISKYRSLTNALWKGGAKLNCIQHGRISGQSSDHD